MVLTAATQLVVAVVVMAFVSPLLTLVFLTTVPVYVVLLRLSSRRLKPILEDHERKPISYRDLIRAAFALGRKLAGMTAPGEHVGVLLPSSQAAAVTFFALQAVGTGGFADALLGLADGFVGCAFDLVCRATHGNSPSGD